jgi:hypothetical protein
MAQQIAAQAQAMGLDPQTYMQQGEAVSRLLAPAPAQHTSPLPGRVRTQLLCILDNQVGSPI